MRKISTKLLVIAITTAAIIAAVTTISISAARPAFAKINCTFTPEGNTCSGGESLKDIPGGNGLHTTFDEASRQSTFSGGGGVNSGTVVGGGGAHRVCDDFGCQQDVGGSGLHVKGPGGNSGNVPP